MIRKLGKKKKVKKILWLLIFLILPGFLLWGFGGIIQKRGINYAGEIFGKKVSFSEYQAALSACRIRAQMLLGEEFFKIQKYLNLEDQAWEWLILKEEIKKKKIKVTDEQVIAEISKHPLFQYKGKFTREFYLRFLNYLRTSPKEFEEQIRTQLGFTRLFKEVTKEVSLTEEEIREKYKEEQKEDFNEEKFLEEKEEISKRLVETKKTEVFNQFLEELKKEANLQDNIIRRIEIPKEVLVEIPEKISEEIPGEISEEIPKETPEETPEEISEEDTFQR